MDADLKCQLFCLEFLQLNGECKARLIAREAQACGIPGDVCRNLNEMVANGMIKKEKRASRYAYYSVTSREEADGHIGTLRMMEQGA